MAFILLTVNSTFKLFRYVNQDAFGCNRKPTQTNLNMEIRYLTEWQCGLTLRFQGWLIQQLKYFNKGPDYVSTLFSLKSWFHPKVTSPHSQRMAISGNLSCNLPSSHLAGAKLPVAFFSEWRINFQEVFIYLFSCCGNQIWFTCPFLDQSLLRVIPWTKVKFPIYNAAIQ